MTISARQLARGNADLLDNLDSTYFQQALVSGTNIKTINSSSLLGTGDLVISGAGNDAISIISTNTTAIKYNTYILTASCTLTLPITPTAGDWIVVSNRSGTSTAIIARNGSNIMNLAENMTIDTTTGFFRLTYADATRGWVLV